MNKKSNRRFEECLNTLKSTYIKFLLHIHRLIFFALLLAILFLFRNNAVTFSNTFQAEKIDFFHLKKRKFMQIFLDKE